MRVHYRFPAFTEFWLVALLRWPVDPPKLRFSTWLNLLVTPLVRIDQLLEYANYCKNHRKNNTLKCLLIKFSTSGKSF